MKSQQRNGSVLYQHDKREKKKNTPSCLQKASSVVANTLESAFFRLGCIIGANPLPTILLCLAFVAVFAGGFAFFYQETQPGNLWVPSNSLAQKHKKWIDENYPADYLRFQFIIIEAENVLEPNVISGMLDIDKKIKAIDITGGYGWENLCARLGSTCWSRSILELWSFNDSSIAALNTTSQVINSVNNTARSPIYSMQYDATKFLGGITRDSSGQIISAKAAFMQYVLKSNDSIENEDKSGNDIARQWEKKLIDIAEKGIPNVKKVYYNAQRSNTDIGTGAIFGDINLLFIGFVLIIVFVSLSLGKCNCVFQRVFLSISGVMCVAFSIALSIGLSSYAGVFFGPLHNILPFLLLGVGVDDMFVIVQAWEMIKNDTTDKPMPERIGLMLKKAGVSITVTSLTDIVAFGIGATTVIPALRSFCIYACIGICGIYLFSATFFVACVSLDNRRSGASRNACCCCYVHKDYKPNLCSRREFVQTFFEYYLGPFLTKVPAKVAVLLIAAGLLAPGIYGVIHLKQDFDPNWFVPDDTYLKDYINTNQKYFPGDGQPGYLYVGDIDYPTNFTRLVQLHRDMEAMSKVYTGSVESWYYYFYQWLQTSNNGLVLTSTTPGGTERLPLTDQDFYNLLKIFLSGPGARYTRDIIFTDTNNTVPNHIKISKVAFQHTKMDSASEEIVAMEDMRKLIENVGIQIMYPYSRFYLIWEGNKVIQIELFRNIGLAFLCVFIMTLILIAHPWTCILVSTCIIATLVDVGGLIYWWNLTIDTVTAINLILAVGLAVDYAAHIGHMFMTLKGTRNERTKGTMTNMGTAVFYGGFSTFLAFILLAGSTSYVFTVFFRVFFGVVVFGLFHGLIYLPVILSLVGPAPYLSPEDMQNAEKNSDSLPQKEDIPPQVAANGSIKGMDNAGFDPPQGDMYAKVNKKSKRKIPMENMQVEENGGKEIWSWEDDTMKQQKQQQPNQSYTLPVRGNWNQQQNPYPNWNVQWAQYPAYYTLGARPPQMAVPQGSADWTNLSIPANKKNKSKLGNSTKGDGTPAQPTPQNVMGYNYYGAPQYGQPGFMQPGVQNMYPPDRFYR